MSHSPSLGNSLLMSHHPLARHWRWSRFCWRLGLVLGMASSAIGLSRWWEKAHHIPVYEGSFQVLMRPTAEVANSAPIDENSQVAVLRSPKVLSPVVAQLAQAYPQLSDRQLQQSLSIERMSHSQILNVRYRDTVPDRAIAVLQAIAQTYLQYGKDLHYEGNRRTLNIVESQLQQLHRDRDAQQAQLQDLQAQGSIDPTIELQQVMVRLTQLQELQIAVQVQGQQQQALYNRLRRELGLEPEAALAAASLSQSPRYQALKEQLQAVETQIARELTRFREESLPIRVLRQKQENLAALLQQAAQEILSPELAEIVSDRPDLAEPNSVRQQLTEQLVSAANQLEVLQVQQMALDREIQQLSDRLPQFPEALQAFANVQLNLQQLTERIDRLDRDRQALVLQIQTTPEFPWETIAPPAIPKSESGQLIALPLVPDGWALVMAGVAGAGVGVLVLALLHRERRFETGTDVLASTQLPLLAQVPISNLKRSARGSFAFQRALQVLDANWLSAEKGRSVVVSSVGVGEGKSTIALHWALAAATAGKRVLLVDANLRQPTLHHLVDLGCRSDSQQGLSDALLREDLEFDESLVRSALTDNLFVLTAGTFRPDPELFFTSDSLKLLVRRLHGRFDLVVYDTPALCQGTDARQLAAHTDGMAIVVMLEHAQMEETLQVLTELQVSGTHILGAIVNGVDEMESIAFSANRQSGERELIVNS
jgi:polysaccharide biosynthesis transport protein